MSDRVNRPWKIHAQDPAGATRLGRALGVPRVVGQLLLNRGLADPAAARAWLAADVAGLPTPDDLPGAVEAGRELAAAAAGGGKICVYGDYDVDGTTGASGLARVLRGLGAAVTVYIPHRLDEGYGLNAAAVEGVARAGHTHLVTVDCGVTAVAELDRARALRLRTVVTDHHQPGPAWPDTVVVHPARPGAASRAPNLCGSAVAWTVARAAAHAAGAAARLDRELRIGQALAAVGTVADVVPLVGENRVLVRHGLASIPALGDAGLDALLGVCGLADKPVMAEDVGFKLGPRINAAGRLGAALQVVRLLADGPTPEAAARIAEYLDYANRRRQAVERAILDAARDQAAAQVAAGAAGLVVASADWHPGVIGIVASRLVERFGRPALVVSFGTATGVGYGSGRSIPGIALHEALRACDAHLVRHGGHAMAAGFKVDPASLDAFRAAFAGHCGGLYGGPPDPPPRVAEAEARIGELDFDLLAALARLEPHGAANPRPAFALKGCRVEAAKRIGQHEDHLSVTLSHPPGGRADRIRCVGFGMGERLGEARGFLDVLGVPRANEWQGRRAVELELADFRPAGRAG
jgi:single-stranded-DNA-specific exonuclease